MKITIRNVRGCERADLDVDTIALLAGLNRAGKSSVAEAVGAALTGQAGAGRLGSRDSLGIMVRTGASDAGVEIANDSGTTMMMWPSGRGRTEGDGPTSSVYAVGLSSLVSLAPKERARVLAEYLHADPTLDDLAVALAAHGWDRAFAEQVWQRLTEQGWDGFHKLRQERGAELKGQWRQIVGGGQSYGSKIAAAWRPDLAELREGDLLAAVGRAKADVENAVAAAAVSSAERDRLVGEAAKLDEASGNALRTDAEVTKAAEALAAAQQARLACDPAERALTVPCPHCKAPIIVRATDLAGGFTLEMPDKAALDDAEVKRRRNAIATADGRVAHAHDELNLARRAQAEAKAAVERAEQAAARLKSWPAAVETGTNAEAAREALQRAEVKLREFRTKVEADKRHREIEGNEALLGILAPDGLRAKKLAETVEVFFGETGLRGLTDAAGWEPVTVDADMGLWLGARPYAVLSTSEQYRVRAVLAVGMAKLDGSDLIVLDAADVLDGPTRGGLLAMLDAAGTPALVCMTLTRREQVPEPAREFSYWIAGGVAEPLVPHAQAA